MLKVFFILIFSGIVSFCVAQERCATVEYEKIRSIKNPRQESSEQFELWMERNLRSKTFEAKKNDAGQRVQGGSTYIIPVVVHIIHNGEAVGIGTNISEAQILSQISVINADYKRLNADTANTPLEWRAVAGKFPITFVMAKQDPDGNPTTGIVRVKGTQSLWGISDNYTLKSLSYWPAENYLNIWVTNLSNGYLGYTQLPVSNTVQGLQDTFNDRLTDGVVINYQAFGTVKATGGSSFNLLPKYNLGRTATHEIGHFFGLRHVWGDVSSCDPNVSTDYVADTPVQDTNFNGLCPSGTVTNCAQDVMYDNYLNYTDDACMNIFSAGQVARMDVIINSSPRRLSLLTSPGLSNPVGYPTTAFAITKLVRPSPVSCQNSIAPIITVKNKGSNSINSFQATITVNGNKTTQNINNINVSVGASSDVTLAAISFVNGKNLIKIKINLPNGTGASIADSLQSEIVINNSTDIIPLRENFDQTFPSTWVSMSPTQGSVWYPTATTLTKKMSLLFDAFTNPTLGEQAWLVSPTLDFSNTNLASVFFQTSYAYNSPNSEIIQVFSSTDCGETFDNLLFSKPGNALANTLSNSNWIPKTDDTWTTNYINLSSLAGQQNVRLAFVATNGNGNNLYLDNIEFFVSDDKTPVTISNLYAVYGGINMPVMITFHLPDRQSVRLQVYDVTGQVFSDEVLTDVLNQTYSVNANLSPGIYIVRIQTNAGVSSTKVLIGFN